MASLYIHVKRFIVKLIWYDSKKVKLFVLVVLICSVSFYSWLFSIVLADRLRDDHFLRTYKCPACFGNSLCSKIHEGKVTLEGWSRLSPLDLVNVKNVHIGTSNGFKVVIKKLGRNHELRALDSKICEAAGYSKRCDVNVAIQKHPIVMARELTPSLLKGVSDLFACPSQRVIDFVEKKFEEDPEAKTGHRHLSHQGRMRLVTTLMINPETVLMQIFPRAEGWPFPVYKGACGRLVVEEHAGTPLVDLYNAPWEERVDFAYQVMSIARLFTENDLGFALYWTDLSYDNLAVNKDGKVVVVDLENIIVVDKAKIRREKLPGWDELYSSKFDECPNGVGSCISFSVTSLCTSYDADFNYYSACRNLLGPEASEPTRPGGLLHDLPAEIDARLKPLLAECTKPKEPVGRMKIKDVLMKELLSIRNDVL